MHEDLGISYVALGIFLAILNLSGAAAQIPIGFLVDRLGARKILIFGEVQPNDLSNTLREISFSKWNVEIEWDEP